MTPDYQLSAFTLQATMSQLGHKRTNRPGLKSTVVRYCPKADKRGCGWIVR